jgi:cytochrome c
MPKPKKWKRKGPKSVRAGCLLCHPHKHQGLKNTKSYATAPLLRDQEDTRSQLADFVSLAELVDWEIRSEKDRRIENLIFEIFNNIESNWTEYGTEAGRLRQALS